MPGVVVEPSSAATRFSVEVTRLEADRPKYYGSALAGGDVNGDGFADLLIGARLSWGGNIDSGEAFLHLGSASGIELVPAWEVTSDGAFAELGRAVALGDVNADGYADAAIGLPQSGEDPEDFSFKPGAVHVYHGSADGFGVEPDWRADATQDLSQFGRAVAWVGDVNGDGFEDLAVGAPWYDEGDVDRGQATLYLGSAAGLQDTPVWTAIGDAAESFFGHAVTGAGDVDGDGYDDVLVGAPGPVRQLGLGRAWLFRGTSTGLEAVAAWGSEIEPGAGERGWDVAGVGDLNGDGYDDVLVGAGHDTGGARDVGVYLGSSSGLAATPDQRVVWAEPSESFGRSVSAAGDVDGDGLADVLISAEADINASGSSGFVALYLGASAGIAPSPDWVGESEAYLDEYGYAATGVGDLDGDGAPDIAVGAPRFSQVVDRDYGAVYVYASGAEPQGDTDTDSDSDTDSDTDADTDADGSPSAEADDGKGGCSTVQRPAWLLTLPAVLFVRRRRVPDHGA